MDLPSRLSLDHSNNRKAIVRGQYCQEFLRSEQVEDRQGGTKSSREVFDGQSARALARIQVRSAPVARDLTEAHELSSLKSLHFASPALCGESCFSFGRGFTAMDHDVIERCRTVCAAAAPLERN